MKIIRLDVEAFKRIKAVSIKPDGSLVVVGGKNAAGKSSTLDAIEAVLGGGKRAPSDPIKHGTKKARIVLETEELVVTRTFTAKGSQLEVKAKDGGKVASPQKMLDGLVGPVSFDPLGFARMKAVDQAATLRQIVGLDFTAEDEKRQNAYDQRTDVGRELRRLQGALDKLPDPPANTPKEPVSTSELAAELERRREANTANTKRRAELDALRAKAIALKENIAALEKELEEQRADFAALNEKGKVLGAEVKELVDEDLEELRQRIASADDINAAVRSRQDRDKMQADLDTQIAESERLTQYISQVDETKADVAAQAKYPIEGLALTDDGVTLDGVPFEQASQAQRLRTSVAIGLALNPELKVLLVRDGSLLDEDSLRLVAEMADAAGGQVWLERVSMDGAGCSVVIEDGEVA